MDKKTLEYSIAYSEVPLVSEGMLYDVYVLDEKFFPGRGKKLDSIRIKQPFIRGIVIEQDLPKNGGVFRIYHNKVMGASQYGVMYLDNCASTYTEDGMIYFTGGPSSLKYLLKPAQVD